LEKEFYEILVREILGRDLFEIMRSTGKQNSLQENKAVENNTGL
jgi:hypothetical protein